MKGHLVQPNSNQPRWFLATAIASLIFVAGSAVTAAAQERIAWKTGDAFRRQLQQPVGFRWESNPIREALANLARNREIAIWLDRRVDPGYPLDLSVDRVPLQAALQQIAAKVGCDVSYVDSVAYVGPQHLTEQLATIAAVKRDAVKALPAPARARFEARGAWNWEVLTTPHELFRQLSAEGDVKPSNLERLPHDLWPAGELPALPLTDRFTLLLAGFDLTFDLARDGSAIRPAPMPRDVAVTRTYTPSGSLRDAVAQVAKAFPAVTVSRKGSRLEVAGKFEDQQRIARYLRGEAIRTPQPAVGETGYDLRAMNQPIGAILKLIAKREKLTVRVDPTIQAILQKRVSLDVKQQKLEELLRHILEPAEVRYRLDGDTLELLPR